MTILTLAGLLLGVTGPAVALEHRVAVEHRGGTVDAAYRAELSIHHRQVGSVSAPGRPSTLRCQWPADLYVARAARHARGTAGRALRRQGLDPRNRPGLCGPPRPETPRLQRGDCTTLGAPTSASGRTRRPTRPPARGPGARIRAASCPIRRAPRVSTSIPPFPDASPSRATAAGGASATPQSSAASISFARSATA